MSAPVVALTVDGERLVHAERWAGDRPDAVPDLPPDAAAAMAEAIRTWPDHRLAWVDLSVARDLRSPHEWAGLLRHPRELRHAGFVHRNDPAWCSAAAVDFHSPLVRPAPADTAYGTWLVSPLAGVAEARLLAACGLDRPVLGFVPGMLTAGHRAIGAGALVWSDPALARAPANEVIGPEVAWRDVAAAVHHISGPKFLPLWAAASAGGTRPWRAAARALSGALGPTLRRGPAEVISEPAPPPLPARDDSDTTVDAVIASLDRRTLLLDVLTDLARQTAPLRRVVVVEQILAGMTDPGPITLDAPFELIHRRIDRPGAVNARNAGLRECRSEWVLFIDDDVRVGPTTVEHLVRTAQTLGAEAVTARVWTVPTGDAVVQQPPRVTGGWPVMWSSFNTGAALAARSLVNRVAGFDRRLDGGFGEDHEWGARARRAGAMVVYDPDAAVPHLKHGEGGLRRTFPHPWHDVGDQPRPSPTVVLSRRLFETDVMRRAWMIHYWSRRLRDGAWRRPVRNWRDWRAALRWADRLERSCPAEEATAL